MRFDLTIARYVEFFWGDQVLNFRRLIDNQLEHKNGRLVLHQAPGLGFGLDGEQVSRVAKWGVLEQGPTEGRCRAFWKYPRRW